jgi:hypothetical protein
MTKIGEQIFHRSENAAVALRNNHFAVVSRTSALEMSPKWFEKKLRNTSAMNRALTSNYMPTRPLCADSTACSSTQDITDVKNRVNVI